MGKCLDSYMFAFSNPKRLREFIREVYVERKYTGERSNILPSVRLVIFRIMLYFMRLVTSGRVNTFFGALKLKCHSNDLGP